MKLCRVQFEMPESKLKDLEWLMRQTGTQTKRELFNNAITLLEWAVKERKRGRVVSSIDEEAGRYSELHMPILSAVKAESTQEETNRDKLASVGHSWRLLCGERHAT
jgi:hypothetical protein